MDAADRVQRVVAVLVLVGVTTACGADAAATVDDAPPAVGTEQPTSGTDDGYRGFDY